MSWSLFCDPDVMVNYVNYLRGDSCLIDVTGGWLLFLFFVIFLFVIAFIGGRN